MARPFKTGVDYFPLDVNIDDKIELLEAEHGIVGFGVWIKLLQKIYANNYWINWNNKSVIVFGNRVNVDKNTVNVIINSCVEWEIFDKSMLEKYEILTSRGIQKRFFEITKRRSKVEAIKEYLLISPPDEENIIIVNVDKNSVNVDRSTQRKGKETKKKKDMSSPAFKKLWNDYPNVKGSKAQTLANYNSCIRKYSLSEDQIYAACMNSLEKQKSEGNSFFYQLSNVLGQKYSGDIPELLSYEPKSQEAKDKMDAIDLLPDMEGI